MTAGMLGTLGQAHNRDLVLGGGGRALVAMGIRKVHMAAGSGHDALDMLALNGAGSVTEGKRKG